MAGKGTAHVWASLALAVVSVAAVTVTSVTGTDATDVLTVIGTVVTPTTAILLTGRALADRVQRVHHEVNGRMTELVRKLPEPPPRGE